MSRFFRMIFMCFTLFILNSFVTFAGQERSIESIGYTITFPGTVYIITDDTSQDNPYYDKFDIDYDEFNSYLAENRIDIYGIDPNFHYDAAVSSTQEDECQNFFTMDSGEMDAYVTAYRTEANNNRVNLVSASWMALDSGLKYVEVIYIQNGTRNYKFFTSNGQVLVNIDFIRSQECYLEETYFLDIIKKTTFENPIPAEESNPTLAETNEDIDNTVRHTSFSKDAIANDLLKVVGILIIIAVFLLFRGALEKKQTIKLENENQSLNDSVQKTETGNRISSKPQPLNIIERDKLLKDSQFGDEASQDMKKNSMPVIKVIKKKDNVLYCRRCGRKIPSDSDFCQYCGTKVSRDEAVEINELSSKGSANRLHDSNTTGSESDIILFLTVGERPTVKTKTGYIQLNLNFIFIRGRGRIENLLSEMINVERDALLSDPRTASICCEYFIFLANLITYISREIKQYSEEIVKKAAYPVLGESIPTGAAFAFNNSSGEQLNQNIVNEFIVKRIHEYDALASNHIMYEGYMHDLTISSDTTIQSKWEAFCDYTILRLKNSKHALYLNDILDKENISFGESIVYRPLFEEIGNQVMQAIKEFDKIRWYCQ